MWHTGEDVRGKLWHWRVLVTTVHDKEQKRIEKEQAKIQKQQEKEAAKQAKTAAKAEAAMEAVTVRNSPTCAVNGPVAPVARAMPRERV